MSQAMDLSHIYQLRNDFTIIGLTGRTGSGCTEVAEQLANGFDDGENFEDPFTLGFSNLEFKNNSYRKYRIIYDYAKVNFSAFTLIRYKDILTSFLLQYPFCKFIEFLNSPQIKNEFEKSNLHISVDLTKEISELNELKDEFGNFEKKYSEIDFNHLDENGNWGKLYNFYFESDFTLFSNKIHEILKKQSVIKRNKILQIISNNLRKSGMSFDFSNISADKVFTIVEFINILIKSYRRHSNNGRTQIVIDSLRNPIEIMFFRQRFAAYYTFAVNRDDVSRRYVLEGKYTMDRWTDTINFLEEEYKGGEDNEFFKPNVSACIQQADIHLTFIESAKAQEKNQQIIEEFEKNPIHIDNTSPYLSWQIQLLKYVSLISHPGLITPSPEERCMQLAYTAKHNSGCISRHVGAAITDEFFSVKAIGWNNTPEGQVPCVLRNAEDLINPKSDIKAFTDYERKPEFRNILSDKFKTPIEDNKTNIKGRTISFCFKALKNSFSEGKNQVHTRSLHAEESAFLQITKYGGTGIRNGILFTTASPCELCAKKAYQLGIKIIYYIDPYPGISEEHILTSGKKPIEIRLFNGAIGNSYHWLYDPIMPYKDEISLLLGNKFVDLTSRYRAELSNKDRLIAEKNAKIEELENKLAKATMKL